MNNRTIPIVSDCILVFLGAAALSFVALRFYSGLTASIILSVVFAALSETIFVLLTKKRTRNYILKAKDAEKAEKAMFALCVSKEDELNKFFSSFLKKMQIPFSSENGVIVLSESNAELHYKFTFASVTENEIIEEYKKTAKGRNVLVCGKSFSEESVSLSKRFGGRIILADGGALYSVMKRFEFFPPENENYVRAKKKNVPYLFANFFSRKNAGRFLLYGILLELFGALSFFPVYYSVSGGIFIILSLSVFFFGLKDELPPDNPFRIANGENRAPKL